MKRLTLATLGALAVMMSAQALATITSVGPPVYIQPNYGWQKLQLITATQNSGTDRVCSFQTTGDNIPIHLVYVNFKPDAGSDHGTTYIIKHPGAILLHFKGKMIDKGISQGSGISIINEDYNYSSYAANTLIVECTTYDYQ